VAFGGEEERGVVNGDDTGTGFREGDNEGRAVVQVYSFCQEFEREDGLFPENALKRLTRSEIDLKIAGQSFEMAKILTRDEEEILACGVKARERVHEIFDVVAYAVRLAFEKKRVDGDAHESGSG
jgi:hypothetical protein